MIDMANAPADGRLHLIEGSVRMPCVAANAALTAGADECLRARQLGSDRRRGDAVGVVEKRQVIIRLRWPHRRARMTTSCLHGEIRTIEMSAENGRSAGALRLQTATDFKKSAMLFVAGDGGCRQQTRRTVASMSAADSAKSIGGAVHEIGAGSAVDV